MVGLHVYNNIEGIDKSVNYMTSLQLEEFHKITEYFNDGHVSFGCSYYEGYPINQYSDDEVIIVFEGMIYNRINDEVYSFCKSLARKVSDTILTKQLINDFVESSDGDYLIFIYLKTGSQYLVFNDLIGRLPFYYFFDSKCLIAGRSISFLVHNMPKIRIDKNALTEFLMIEFLIGENTLFKDIKRLKPAEILFVSTSNDHLNLISETSKKESYETDNPFSTKEEALDALYQAYKINAKNRIDKFNMQGYNIFNTLSGGFDSRAVFGIIDNITPNFTNVTYEYCQDESIIARQVLEKTNSRSNYVKLSFNNDVNYLDSPLIFRTGNSVNIYTTSVCYNDSLFLKKQILKTKDVVFGGFGGEFIRHPYHSFPISPYNYLCNFVASVPIHKLAPIFNISLSGFKNFIMSTFKQYNEKSNEAIYKHLYNEYYRNYVVGAGEDRMRLFVWTAHPLMSTSFMKIIRNRIPLKWTSFQFFTDFLFKVNSSLLDVPIYGSKVDLYNRKSINKLTPINQKLIKTILSTLAKKYGLRHHKHFRKESNSMEFKNFEIFYQKLDFYKNFLNYNYIKKEYYEWPPIIRYRLQSTIMYLYELEKRYRDKLVI